MGNLLRQSLDGVALVRLDHLAVSELLVRVGGPGNQSSSVVDDAQSSEPLVVPELAAPGAGDGECAAVGSAVGGAAGDGVAVPADRVGTGSGTSTGVDAEGPVAGCVIAVAGALHALDGPGGRGGHVLDLGRDCESAGREKGGEEGGGRELHGCDFWYLATR